MLGMNDPSVLFLHKPSLPLSLTPTFFAATQCRRREFGKLHHACGSADILGTVEERTDLSLNLFLDKHRNCNNYFGLLSDLHSINNIVLGEV